MAHITTREAAKLARVNPRTVRRWVAGYAVRAMRVKGNRIMVDVASLNRRIAMGRKAEIWETETDNTRCVLTLRKSIANGDELVKLASLADHAESEGHATVDMWREYDAIGVVSNARQWRAYLTHASDARPATFTTYQDCEEFANLVKELAAKHAGTWVKPMPHKRVGVDVAPTNNGNGTGMKKAVKMASAKQCATVRNMWAKKDVEFTGEDLAIASLAVLWAEYADGKNENRPEKELTHNEISPIIGKIFDANWKPRESKPKADRAPSAPVAELEAGMYLWEDRIFKVQIAVHGSGKPYAKEFTENGFEYAPGMVRNLSADNRMTLDQAKEFGALYGTCIVCGRTLTDEKSIAAGIGPICSERV